MNDTIAAIATPPGPGAIGIVRLSGPASRTIGESLFHSSRPQFSGLKPYRLHHGQLRSQRGVFLDDALLAFMPGPASFTGEDVVELQCHGGLRHVEQVLAAARAAGARSAEPGEFSRRAVVNGRLSLERAEALLDLVTAETAEALGAARAQLLGRVGEVVHQLSRDALDLRAEVEASLDFPEDVGDVPEGVRARAELLAQRCEALLATHRFGRALREGARIVLAGAPNAGKSSLFNALLDDERALVDEEAGTTRDSLEARIDLGGIPCTLVDTAGLRDDGAGRVEQRGMARTRVEVERAVVAVWVLDLGAPVPPPEPAPEGGWLVVQNKADLFPTGTGLAVSATTGQGMANLRDALSQRLCGGFRASGELVITHRRHAELLEQAAAAFHQATESAQSRPLELVAYDLAAGARALEQICGRGVDDSLLDTVFAKFCIGK